MFKKILATTILGLGLASSAIAAPGQPPAIKSWTIITMIPNPGSEMIVTYYGTFRTYSACVSSLKSIVQSNPYLNEFDGTPASNTDDGPTLACVPGTGPFTM